jgi:hypothetical protein
MIEYQDEPPEKSFNPLIANSEVTRKPVTEII